MEQKIKQYMLEQEMVVPKETIYVACSGGADSVCLLLLLHRLEAQLQFQLEVLHVEHGIRGEESRRDQIFVENLCQTLSIPLQVKQVDVPAFAQKEKIGLEEAARILRYRAFLEMSGGHGKIALAHHAEDNAETILFQLARGSGLAGLLGMQPVRRDGAVTYIRPLLLANRREIEQYLTEQGQNYCSDGTNADDFYSRNRIRHHILPELEKINSQAVLHINQSAARLREIYAFLESETDKAFVESACFEEDELRLDAKKLALTPDAIRTEVLRKALFLVSGHKKDILSEHIDGVSKLIDKQSGKRINLPYGVEAYRQFETICLRKEKKAVEREVFLEVTGDELASCKEDRESREINLPGGEKFIFHIYGRTSKKDEIIKKTYTKQLDYDKIKNGFSIRKRMPGDFLTVDSEGHRKKLKKYLIDEKIPMHKRSELFLLAQGSEVIWIIGGRINENYKVTEDTDCILEITYNGGKSDGFYREA